MRKLLASSTVLPRRLLYNFWYATLHSTFGILLYIVLASPVFSFGESADPAPNTRLTFSFRTQTFSFDPSQILSVFESQLHQALYATLVRLDSYNYSINPGIAISWTISDDGLLYRFNLRDDAQFSDTSRIEAQDVVRSFLRLLENESPFVFLMSPIEGVEDYVAGTSSLNEVYIKAVSPRVLEIKLTTKTPHFLKTITHAAFSVISHRQDSEQDFASLAPEDIVVSGAYKVQSYVQDESLTLIANEYYWSRDTMKNDSVIIYFTDGEDYDYVITDFNRMLIHWTNLPLSEFELKRIDTIQVNRTYGTEFLHFNTKREPWNRPRVRRAIRLLLPMQELKESSYSLPANELISLPNYTSLSSAIDADIDSGISPDEHAYKMLEEEGFPRGEGLGAIAFLVPEYRSGDIDPIYTKMTSILANKLSTDISIISVPYSELYEAQKTQPYAVTVFSWIGDFADPMAFLQLFYAENKSMSIHYADQSYRDIIDRANQADSLSRYDILSTAELQLLRDTVVIPLSYSFSVHYVSHILKGWNANVLEIYPYEKMYIEYGEVPKRVATLPLTVHSP